MTKMERRESGEKVGDKKCLLFVAVGIIVKKRNEIRTNTKRCWKFRKLNSKLALILG